MFCIFLQPAIYVTSLAAVEILRTREGGQQIIDSVDVTCGLSLGEYTALAFAGAFRCVMQFSNIFAGCVIFPFMVHYSVLNLMQRLIIILEFRSDDMFFQ